MSWKSLATLACGFALCASASAQTTAFVAIINGGQEVPVVASANTGVGEFILDPFTNMLRYDVTITGLTGAITGSHIHTGAVGVNGGIIFNLAGGPTSFSGTVGPLSGAQVTSLRNSGLYCNFHSTTFPGGEIRGQITPMRNQAIVAISAAKEVPPTPGGASGTALLSINGANQVVYDITFAGLSSAFTASHIHDGAAGVNGGILFNLTLVGPGHLQGTTAALSAVQLAKFRAGLLYVNIHSTMFPGGEMRGQTTASYTDYGSGCPHGGGTATLSGGGATIPGGTVNIDVNNGVPSAFGILEVSAFAFKGSIGFGCPFYVHPSVLIPITLPLPPSGSISLPAVLPPTTAPGTVIALQYIGDKGAGKPYDTNGLQMNITN